MRRITTEASQSGDWATPQLRIASGTDPLKRVASALLDLSEAAGLPADWNSGNVITEQVARIRAQVGTGRVLSALSGVALKGIEGRNAE